MDNNKKPTGKFDTPEKKVALGIVVIIGVVIFLIGMFIVKSVGEMNKSFEKTATERAASSQPTEADKAKSEADAKAKAEAEKELDADIKFSSTAFMIANKETQNWTECKFVINGKLFGSDYSYKTAAGIGANDSIIVPMSEFTKSDGTRFNPDSTKAKNLFIICNVDSNQRSGYYTINE